MCRTGSVQDRHVRPLALHQRGLAPADTTASALRPNDFASNVARRTPVESKLNTSTCDSVIPACTGRTQRRTRRCPPVGVIPAHAGRMSGMPVWAQSGSSPHVRSARQRGLAGQPDHGPIPAYAGHATACGRGVALVRPIPVRAGRTARDRARDAGFRTHPRRAERTGVSATPHRPRDLSPCVRGAPDTRAGFTPSRTTPSQVYAVTKDRSPRVRDGPVRAADRWRWNDPSPRVRGASHAAQALGARRGPMPAHAGRTIIKLPVGIVSGLLGDVELVEVEDGAADRA
jgi:hypothetical protein